MKGKKPQDHIEPSDLLVEETRTFWREMAKEQVRASISAIDEFAKQIIGVSAILAGLYFNAITLSKLQGSMDFGWPFAIYLLPLFSLLISLSASLMVFFPNYYHLNLHSSEGSRELHQRVMKRKKIFQRVASLSLILSVLALFVAVVAYLHR